MLCAWTVRGRLYCSEHPGPVVTSLALGTPLDLEPPHGGPSHTVGAALATLRRCLPRASHSTKRDARQRRHALIAHRGIGILLFLVIKEDLQTDPLSCPSPPRRSLFLPSVSLAFSCAKVGPLLLHFLRNLRPVTNQLALSRSILPLLTFICKSDTHLDNLLPANKLSRWQFYVLIAAHTPLLSYLPFATMSAAGLPVLSPLVTRIIEVSGFSSDLKTRDVQAAFATWEDEKGGFKIKWVDDTSVLIIFADAATGRSFLLVQRKRMNQSSSNAISCFTCSQEGISEHLDVPTCRARRCFGSKSAGQAVRRRRCNDYHSLSASPDALSF